MIGTAYWYLATDQWRYDTFSADAFASPVSQGKFAGLATADLIATSARLGWMPSYPTFNWNPLDLADALERSGEEPAAFIADELAAGRLRFAAEDPDAPENFPRILTVWRANLLGSSGKGNEYFLKHLLGASSSVRASARRVRGNASRADELRPARPRLAALLRHFLGDVVIGVRMRGGKQTATGSPPPAVLRFTGLTCPARTPGKCCGGKHGERD